MGRVFSSTQYLAIHEGTGLSNLFGNPLIRPRVWNGLVKYTLDEGSVDYQTIFENGCENDISTTFDNNIGSFGNMFDIVTYNSSIHLQGFQFYTDKLEPVMYEIYTKEGSYVDGIFLSNWTLLGKGTVNGLGSGRGTPVRNFSTLNIPQNVTQAFYVTLSTADIRYRDITAELPGALPGDVYFQNEDLEIQIGVSVGTYPMSTTFFGPRLWCGSLEYTANHECPSVAPSLQPSKTPSVAPSLFPSTAPTLGVPDFGNCTNISIIETTKEGGTAAFGSMYTTSTFDEPVSILSLDFYTPITAVVTVQVYSKHGDYKGYEADEAAWRKITDATLRGGGQGSITQIPEALFDAVHMLPNQTRAFYVTMSTPDCSTLEPLSNLAKLMWLPNFSKSMLEPVWQTLYLANRSTNLEFSMEQYIFVTPTIASLS